MKETLSPLICYFNKQWIYSLLFLQNWLFYLNIIIWKMKIAIFVKH